MPRCTRVLSDIDYGVQQMQVNITQAARMAGVDRTTMQRKVKQGLISSTKDSQDRPQIALSELLRVYPDVQQRSTEVDRSLPHTGTVASDPNDLVKALREQIDLLRKQVDFQQQQLNAKDEQLKKALEVAEGVKKIEHATPNKSRVMEIFEKVLP